MTCRHRAEYSGNLMPSLWPSANNHSQASFSFCLGAIRPLALPDLYWLLELIKNGIEDQYKEFSSTGLRICYG